MGGNPSSPSVPALHGGARIVGGAVNLSGPGPQVMAASSLRGDKVYNSMGEPLGEIQEIMLDVPTGRIAYAVLSFGGIMGFADKLFAIPWGAMTLDADRACFVLDVPREELENAPGFDRHHWPSMADPTWVEEIHAFYRSRPYWE